MLSSSRGGPDVGKYPGLVLDGRATSQALLANMVENVRRRRLTLATAHPRREALRFLEEARWSPSGLIAYEGVPQVTRSMFRLAALSARIDRSALADLGWGLHEGRRRHPFDDFWPVDYWKLLLTITDPCAFKPPAHWSVLWALLQGEQSFQTTWVDAWSHEERLTGHFLTAAATAGSKLQPAFQALDRASGGGARCSVDYLDTATGRRERETGADFGVIVHGADRIHGEWVKALLFQVKKSETFGRFEIDFDQLQTLLRRPELGYYLLVTQNSPSAPPPVVIGADRFESDLHKRSEERQKPTPTRTDTLGSGIVDRGYDCQDWAFFIALAASDPSSDVGVVSPSPSEATRLLLRRSPMPPSRILAFGLGEVAGRTNWRQLVETHRGDQ